jgi:hypothetical protein
VEEEGKNALEVAQEKAKTPEKSTETQGRRAVSEPHLPFGRLTERVSCQTLLMGVANILWCAYAIQDTRQNGA